MRSPGWGNGCRTGRNRELVTERIHSAAHDLSASPTPLLSSQIDGASAVLARSFTASPVCRYLVPDDEDRESRLIPAYRAFTAYILLSGEAWTTTGKILGVALWLPPSYLPNPEYWEVSGLSGLSSDLGAETTDRMFGYHGYLQSVRERKVLDPHWYLMILGVDPSSQSRGIGSALIEPVLHRSDRDCIPCYLETDQSQNISFYSRHGFVVETEDVEPLSGIRFWGLARHPHRSRSDRES